MSASACSSSSKVLDSADSRVFSSWAATASRVALSSSLCDNAGVRPHNIRNTSVEPFDLGEAVESSFLSNLESSKAISLGIFD